MSKNNMTPYNITDYILHTEEIMAEQIETLQQSRKMISELMEKMEALYVRIIMLESLLDENEIDYAEIGYLDLGEL